jgi:hypothetical protein
MANFAIIINNAVTNIIVADDVATALAVSPDEATAIECDLSLGVSQHGWTYVDNAFVAPTPAE